MKDASSPSAAADLPALLDAIAIADKLRAGLDAEWPRDEIDMEAVRAAELALRAYGEACRASGVPAGGALVYQHPDIEHWAEDHEAAMMCLDKAGVARADDSGAVLSLWGRVVRYAASSGAAVPVAWLFNARKPGDRRELASVDDHGSELWPLDPWHEVTRTPLVVAGPAEVIYTGDGKPYTGPRGWAAPSNPSQPAPYGAAEALRALQAARRFIRNGIEFGVIRMPDADTQDSAHDTLPMIEAAIAALSAESAPSYEQEPKETRGIPIKQDDSKEHGA